MSGTGPIKRTVIVANPNGLHMRPSTAFAMLARNYSSKITVWNGSKQADGKSPMQIMLLVALPGVELTLEIDGADADQAIVPLSELLGADESPE
jgi:phosphocarrier protein HPr